MVSFCCEIFLLCAAALMLTFFIAGLLFICASSTSITWERTPHPVRRPAFSSHLFSTIPYRRCRILNQDRTSTPGRMTEMFHKLAQISLLLILGFSISAVAQLNVAKQAPTNVPNGPLDTTVRIATINMQQTIVASN